MEADRANGKATLPHLRYISIDDGIMFTVRGSNGPACLASGKWASIIRSHSRVQPMVPPMSLAIAMQDIPPVISVEDHVASYRELPN